MRPDLLATLVSTALCTSSFGHLWWETLGISSLPALCALEGSPSTNHLQVFSLHCQFLGARCCTSLWILFPPPGAACFSHPWLPEGYCVPQRSTIHLVWSRSEPFFKLSPSIQRADGRTNQTLENTCDVWQPDTCLPGVSIFLLSSSTPAAHWFHVVGLTPPTPFPF